MPDTPKLTEAEAALLRPHVVQHPAGEVAWNAIVRLTNAGLFRKDTYRIWEITDLGRRALAAFDAEQRAKIEAPWAKRVAKAEAEIVVSRGERCMLFDVLDYFSDQLDKIPEGKLVAALRLMDDADRAVEYRTAYDALVERVSKREPSQEHRAKIRAEEYDRALVEIHEAMLAGIGQRTATEVMAHEVHTRMWRQTIRAEMREECIAFLRSLETDNGDEEPSLFGAARLMREQVKP